MWDDYIEFHEEYVDNMGKEDETIHNVLDAFANDEGLTDE